MSKNFQILSTFDGYEELDGDQANPKRRRILNE